MALTLPVAAAITAGCNAQASAPKVAATPTPIRVALKWIDQAQFAGWYAAIDQGSFTRHGVAVTTSPGRPGANPALHLTDGSADVAEASMDQAVAASTPGDRIVNIAQLFQTADSLLICQIDSDTASAKDLRHAAISVGDRVGMVRQMMDALFPDGHQARFVADQPGVTALTSGAADCQWGSTFNEYWRATAAGLSVFTVSPQDLGIVNVEDGLYVRERRLAEPGFKRALVGVLLGLEDGWAFARQQPASAVQLTLNANPMLDPADQRRQLESILELLGTTFGYFDIGQYETVDGSGVPQLPKALRDRLWTHSVFDAAAEARGDRPFVSPVTRHYVEVIRAAPWYRALVAFGTTAAALAGALLGLRLRYRFWGRLVLATITALGGGLARDLILGGIRTPTYLVHNPTDLYLVFGAAVAVTVLRYTSRSPVSVRRLERVADLADVVGFSVLAVNGATIAIVAQAHALWVPIAAALTVAGGGILTDVLTAREHEGFRGAVYEELAIAGAVCVLLAMRIANGHEHRPVMVLMAVVVPLLLVLATRATIVGLRLRYPRLRLGTRPDLEPVGA